MRRLNRRNGRRGHLWAQALDAKHR
jgi:hypothetical protein